MPPTNPEPLSHPGNLRLFLLFRVFFNARYYYPVYAILFLDFGLSVEQFAVLNFAWALTIVLLEVPSGALADQLGRKALIVTAAILMILEMLVIVVTPVGAGSLVFTMFLANRILSGAAEAAASGADEALAYDSIPEDERESTWPKLMAKLMRWQSVGFIVVTIVGAGIYDVDVVNSILARLGSAITLDQATTLKFPLILTLLHGVVTLGITLRMREPGHDSPPLAGEGNPLIRSFKNTLVAGGWILKTPAAFALILIGLFYDSIIRLFYTINSSYYRLLQIDEAWFGIIGAVASVIGILSAYLVERLATRRTPGANFRLVTLLVLTGLIGLAFPIPVYGVILVAPFWIAMRYLHFFVSHYLNKVTDSRHRATVLSFKGLSMNLAYGLITLLFGLHTNVLKKRAGDTAISREGILAQDDPDLLALALSLQWWPVYFAAVAAGLALFIRLHYRCSITGLIAKEAPV